MPTGLHERWGPNGASVRFPQSGTGCAETIKEIVFSTG